jgi:IrrE N-terminal-like domain
MKQTNFVDILCHAFAGNSAFAIVRQLVDEFTGRLAPTGPPFDPRLIAGHFGISVLECNIPNEGFLTTGFRLAEHLLEFKEIVKPTEQVKLDPEAPVIVVRSLPVKSTAVSRRKQRFTVAHELGHWFLRKQIEERSGVRVEFRNGDPDEEMLCNLFAAELLVPTDLLVKDLSCPDFGLAKLVELTDTYDVNLSTVLVKTASLSRHYVAFALFGHRSDFIDIRFSTPCGRQAIFFHCELRADVSHTFKSQEQLQSIYFVEVGGEQKRLDAQHLPVEDNRNVLTFVHEEPFETVPVRTLRAAAGAG